MIKKLTLQGSPREIGRQHGSQGKAEVHKSLETYEKLFHGYKGINWGEARKIALEHLPAIKQYDQQLIEEMQGVAEGAGVEFEDILALNARSEIALANYRGANFSDGCTAIAVTAPLTTDTIVGQNWDWKAEQKESLLLLEIRSETKPVITMVTEGGIIGKIGFNSAGVGLCFNALLTDKKSNEIPIHLGLRSVLNSSSLHEAISKIKGGQIAAAASFLIGIDEGNGQGMALNVEVSPFGIDMVGGNDGKLVHTNHLVSPILKQNLKDMSEFVFDDSMIRKKRAEQLIDTWIARQHPIHEETFKEWLSDHFNAPNSIDHYENLRAPEHRRMETVFSIIMNLSERKVWLCVGHPSDAQFEEIK
ncbi:C45 family autoproteolytic acyltransferase/hydolase [Halobacillus naozhouensis]|uniref:C45 family autoproteolytic acyltransferase/hydrolase n=1 Tax=Halobacillus naozhouensis TaxID=554880 RepID=A0ABY8J2R0_9BACI|nr:C45 family peptidase [Halobacillus naozhouensis]WFT75714.1 C45 family autoproteolytic acyltransferase/hydrolase [Halobacillus naozhouensis]